MVRLFKCQSILNVLLKTKNILQNMLIINPCNTEAINKAIRKSNKYNKIITIRWNFSTNFCRILLIFLNIIIIPPCCLKFYKFDLLRKLLYRKHNTYTSIAYFT